LLGIVGLAGTAHAQLLSPGDLSRAHASIEGDTHCGDCHSSGRRVADAQCNRCHTDVGATVRAGRGLHGQQYRNQSCGGCHVEHRGRSAALIRWPGGSRDAFDHALVGWPLRGGHRAIGCNDCHDSRNSRGARSFLGERTACASCHRDPHSGRLGTSCEGCHDVAAWSTVSLEHFDHAATRFPLRGGHQRVACARCHGTPARYEGIEHGSCTNCHRDPHSGAYGAECTQCHGEESWNRLSAAVRENHPGLRLTAGHSNVACETCHDRGINAPPTRGRACVGCHRPVHEAHFGRRCESCHGSIRWTGLPRRISLSAHARTPFPLRGRHEEVECTSCHQSERPRNERYRELTFDGCTSCHADRHEGEFAQRDGGQCSGCHDESGFAPTLFGAEQHASAAFVLEGRHQAVACGACHRSERPRLDWHVAQSRCADCHQNPHGEQFATEMAEGGCASCHSARGWDRPNIDHTAWPLSGAHELVACRACHSPSEEDRQTGQGASYRGVARECAGCHEDEHAGQFRLTEPRRECTGCHDTSSFSIAHFDHAGIANYPLEGRHAAAECGACHREQRLEGGETATRWRLGYRACRDCHADPHAGAAP
jgi:hypothetical protein